VRFERIAVDGDPVAAAAAVHALAPAPASVGEVVAAIVGAVRDGGDRALRELVARFDMGGAPAPDELRVPAEQLDAGLLDDDVRAGLEVAITNVALVADAAVGADIDVTLPQGHRVVLREVPVRRAAIYVPGGRAPYPSTVVMGVVTARAAGVEEVAVLTPPPIDPVIRATCDLCGVHEVYAMGGAHGVAALAYGTETIERADVIAGPGSLIVQEAKRQVSDSVGIDGFYGPSDVLVFADASADPELVALDLLAQGEHGPGAPVVLVSGSSPRPHSDPAAFVSVHAESLLEALRFCEAYAPEHLELVGASVERLAPRVRCAGCVFVGAAGATAFGDYVAGSNHSLPTGGSARYASGLSPRAFRRRMSEVHIGDAGPALAAAGAPVARAEGFTVHAESMLARVGENAARDDR
jgi:histidinol dehydrogenase